jgi:hypothetical protein
LLANLAQIPCDSALVLHHGDAADYFEVPDLGQESEDFILHAVCEISVFFLGAQTFKR